MKRLNSLYKISKFVKALFPEINLTQTPILLLSLAAFFIGCRLNKSETTEVVTPKKTGKSWSAAMLGDAKVESMAVLYKSKTAKSYEIARISNHQCTAEGGMQTWDVKLISPFAAHLVRFEFANSPGNKGISAEIEGRKILLSTDQVLSAHAITQTCAALSSRSASVELEDATVEGVLSQWLAMLAPDCEIQNEKGQFHCNLGSIEAQSAEETLHEIRRTMVRSWSRQPYILTRRLSVAIILAQALQASDVSKQLDSLCRIVSHADSVELPLALANRRWQDSVCFQKYPDRKQAANIGLLKSLGEIEFLRQLFERTSKLGTLLVRIPRDFAPTKDLWINLTPSADVANNLAAESQSLGAKMSASIDGDFDSPKACWHPLFASDYSSLQLARYLDITGESRGISCLEQSTNSSTGEVQPSSYLAESITSETEFVLTNGHSKMLRLPAGTYSYELRGYYDSLGWEHGVDDKESKGQIIWSTKRPSVAIKNW